MSALGDLIVIDALNSLQNLGQTDKESALALATGQIGTFDLVGAFMFYGVPIGAIMALNSIVRTGFSGADMTSIEDASTDISSYNLNEGVTSIRHLLSRGVGLDTQLVIGDSGTASGGSSVIEVSALFTMMKSPNSLRTKTIQKSWYNSLSTLLMKECPF